MIKINLLPKEERRRRAPINTKVILAGFGALVLLAAMGYGWLWLSAKVTYLEDDIRKTQSELKRYEEMIKKVNRFQEDKKKVEEKIKIIEALVAAQGGPVQLLDEVSKALPNEVWITSLNRVGKRMEISGIAFSNFSVANLMTNLGKATAVVSGVDLVVSEKTTVEEVPVERFTISMEVKEGKG